MRRTRKKSRLFGPKHKSVSWVRDLVGKFSNPGDLVVNLISGTFATAKTYLELPRHHYSVSFEVDIECLVACTEELVDTYERKVCNDRSDILVTDQVVDAYEVVFQALGGL